MNQDFIDINHRWTGGVGETRGINSAYPCYYIIALAIYLGLYLIAKAICCHAHNHNPEKNI